MNIILSHTSALEYWRLARTFPLPQPQPSRACTPGRTAPDDEILRMCAEKSLTPPVHVLVGKGASKPSSRSIVCHTRNDRLPSGSLAIADEKLLVSSPGLLMIQKALDVDPVELIFLGHELCGTYSPLEAPAERKFGQVPETTVAQLEAYLRKAGGMHGVKQARRAARYILPNSASPAESALAMSFSLPYLLGGASFSKPKLNFRIDPGKTARRNVSQDYYKCDLFWEKARLAVEYDSDFCHTGSHRIAKDSIRRDELAGLGITVLTVTTRQFSNFQEFTRLVGTVGKLIDERVQPRDRCFATRQLRFHSLLWNLISHPPL